MLGCFPAFKGMTYGLSRAVGPTDAEAMLEHGWAVGGPRDATLATKLAIAASPIDSAAVPAKSHVLDVVGAVQ